MISKLTTQVQKVLDASYILKFLLRMLGFYLLFRFVNWLWVGLITPEGYYSPFVDHYLDYVTLIRISVMQAGQWMAEVFGVASTLVEDYNIRVRNGGELRMAWACCGLEIMSFWAAFALADTTKRKTKLLWCIGGLLCIWFINCFRVAFLVMAKQYKWEQLLKLDQHDLFNLVAYGFVFLLMFVYYKKNHQSFSH